METGPDINQPPSIADADQQQGQEVVDYANLDKKGERAHGDMRELVREAYERQERGETPTVEITIKGDSGGEYLEPMEVETDEQRLAHYDSEQLKMQEVFNHASFQDFVTKYTTAEDLRLGLLSRDVVTVYGYMKIQIGEILGYPNKEAIHRAMLDLASALSVDDLERLIEKGGRTDAKFLVQEYLLHLKDVPLEKRHVPAALFKTENHGLHWNKESLKAFIESVANS